MGTLQQSVGGRPSQPPSSSHSFKDVLGSHASFATPNLLFDSAPTDPDRQALVGRHKGAPAISFKKQHVQRLAQPFQWTLVGKFSYGYNKHNPKLGRPSGEELQKYLEAFDFRGDLKVGLLNNRHLLIHFKLMEDFLRMFSRPVWYIRGHAMRVLKLPIHFFDKSALFAICSVVGCPLRIDSATASLKIPSLARVQVEIDLLKDRPDKAWIDVEGSNGFWQKLVDEKVPSYCQHCWHVGHSEDLCHVNNPDLKIPLTGIGTDPDDVAAQHVLQEKQAQNHHPNPIQGPAKQNTKALRVSVIGTEHALERLAPPATQKTSSSEKGLSDLSRQDHFPLVAPPTSAAKASMPTNAPAPEIHVESTPEPTGETKPSDHTPQHYPSQEIDNPPKSIPRQPVIVCDHDPSTDDVVAVSDPATRLSRLCDDSVILRRSEFYTADPLSSQDEPIPISTRTEVFQQLRDFYN
ncbi:hypothetical protein K2173_018818 [Erythroxylum novogranatense]|uniref:DUF4283 domain-containing protein n=1 Tax=Erythroxylum novogranatense TaxID=1862640 RepID=A0AAV8SB13_9ROSI|nr:hypothetical protein K2173_018818 [Erythroxylum novogranatense]